MTVKILSRINRNICKGRLGSLKPTVPDQSCINPIKVWFILTKIIAVKGLLIINFVFPFYPSAVSDLTTTACEGLGFKINFFHESFLSPDLYNRGTGLDVINGHSKLMPQRLPRPGAGTVDLEEHCGRVPGFI